MPAYGSGDISERLRNLINMRHSADAEAMAPSTPAVDYSAPAFPEINAAMGAPDPDYVDPFTNTGAFNSKQKKAAAVPPRVGQFYGRG